MEIGYGTIHKPLGRVSCTKVKGSLTMVEVLKKQPYAYNIKIVKMGEKQNCGSTEFTL